MTKRWAYLKLSQYFHWRFGLYILDIGAQLNSFKIKEWNLTLVLAILISTIPHPKLSLKKSQSLQIKTYEDFINRVWPTPHSTQT